MTALFPADILDLATRVIAAHRAAGTRISVAESCTGGLVSAALTEVAGSSAVVERGFVTYSNEAKTEVLGVSPDLIDALGAVSPAVAWAMAQGVLARAPVDLAVAVTGIAGPDGGTAAKPVGTVVFARARRGDDPAAALASTKLFAEASDRTSVRLAAVRVALELLLPEGGAPASA